MQFHNQSEKIIIIDFGSQVTKLIARRIRELGVYCEVLTINELHKIKDFKKIKGLILSGGPSTVTEKNYPSIPKKIFSFCPFFGVGAPTSRRGHAKTRPHTLGPFRNAYRTRQKGGTETSCLLCAAACCSPLLLGSKT